MLQIYIRRIGKLILRFLKIEQKKRKSLLLWYFKDEKYSKDWVLGKGEKKSFWRTLWRFHLFQWVWSARILILVMGGISAIFLFLLENGATFSGIPIEWFGLFLILLALSYLFYILEIWPYD